MLSANFVHPYHNSEADMYHYHCSGMDMRAMASQRQSKIERFRQNKEYEGRLKELSETVEKESVDDEMKVRVGDSFWRGSRCVLVILSAFSITNTFTVFVSLLP